MAALSQGLGSSKTDNKMEWGGMIEAYLSTPDREVRPDPEMEAVVEKLKRLEQARTCSEFTEIFVTFQLLEFHRLNSPLLDAFFEGFYRIPVPAPNVAYHLPTLIESGSVGKNFLDMCMHTFKCPAAVRYLLERENINHRSVSYIAAFFETAICKGNVESFAIVLEKLDVPRCKFRLEIFLEAACEKSSLGIVKSLVELMKGARETASKLLDPQLLGKLNFYNFLKCNPFRKALQRGDLPIIDFLYQEGFCDPSSNLLAEAIKGGHLPVLHWAQERVRQQAASNNPLLPEGKSDDTQLQKTFDTSLVIACHAGSLEVASYLLAQGADPSYEHSEALTVAIDIGDPQLIELLLAHGAVADWRILVKAVHNENLALVRQLLDLGVNPEPGDHQALRTAFGVGIPEITELIINAYRSQPRRDL